ncbi:MAG TPA: alpha-glucosidase family protein [Burkholderiaceae bacterium]|nr:alpha-glucosidase family protein [Burkholderiaceae bacterium]
MSDQNGKNKPSADWWRGAVIYQIYPRSFADSNGDGIGDLAGITAKLDYVARLGVDGVWLSPFFTSPMKDFGYDISDYRDVDPMFGSLQDFDQLLRRAHELGLKVVIDQVYSHTSDQHRWFKESRTDRDNPKADWYVWAQPKLDGTPPNNWLSVFGGSAWQWDTRRRQYYLHNFLSSQPDLNLHNDEVQDQLLAAGKFWLDRGVDGFRMDAVNFCFHDRQLRDNPPWGDRPRTASAQPLANPYAFQQHCYDKTQPENIAFLGRLRALLDEYPAKTSVGEIDSDDSFATMAEYTRGSDRLHMAYAFSLLTKTFSAQHIRTTVETLEASIGDGWPCWSLGNHDVTRVLTRWGGANAPAAFAKVLVALLGSLRGTICIYQGEELALPEADVPFELLQDPFGITFWPEIKGRDGCRTPMPWTANGKFAGFSGAAAWLPIADQHRERAVDVQEKSAESALNSYRRFLAWRRQHPALQQGNIQFIDAPENGLALVREHAKEKIIAAFNLSPQAFAVSVPHGWQVSPLSGHGFMEARAGAQIQLPAYGAFFGTVKR